MNLTVGCKIEVNEPVFAGYGRYARKVGTRTFTGEIVKDSYGDLRGQHTFTILVSASDGTKAPEIGKKVCRKGRTLYRNAKLISAPDNHAELAAEKAERAEAAKDSKFKAWADEAIQNPWDFGHKVDKIPNWWLKDNPDVCLELNDSGFDVDPWNEDPWAYQ